MLQETLAILSAVPALGLLWVSTGSNPLLASLPSRTIPPTLREDDDDLEEEEDDLDEELEEEELEEEDWEEEEDEEADEDEA